MTFVPWSTEEDGQLRKLALSRASMSEIVGRMRRTRSAVRARAVKLKIAIAREQNPMQKRKAGVPPSKRGAAKIQRPLVPHHSDYDWLILSQFRMGRSFG